MIPCIVRPSAYPDLPASDEQSDTRERAATAEWATHLATCHQHCRCSRISEYCAALATQEDGLCDECRDTGKPPTSERERRLLCVIFAHRGPYRPEVHERAESPERT